LKKRQRVEAVLTANLIVCCPKCGLKFDLFTDNNDDEGDFSGPIFNNEWSDLEGRIVECKCGSIFEISNVEY